jgi:hypothetical protein
MQLKDMSHLILRFSYLIIVVFLFGCGRYSESEINSLKMINMTFQEMILTETKKNDQMVNRLEDVVYEGGKKPRDLAVLKSANSFDQSYKEAVNKISLINNNSFNKEELRLTLDELLDRGKNPDIDLRGRDSLLFDKAAHYSSAEIQSLHLNELKLRTVLVASVLLDYYESQVGGYDCFRFDRILPMMVANDIIEEDSVYGAEVFLTTTKSMSSKLLFNLDGKTEITNNKYGEVDFEIPSQKCHYDQNGLCKKSWDGTLTFRIHRKDTIINFHQDYYIRKPCN